MKRNDVLLSYTADQEKLINYGFRKDDDSLIYEKTLSGGLSARLVLNDELTVSILEDGEVFQPFEVKGSEGAYVSKLREEVENILDDVLKNCFRRRDLVFQLKEYAQREFGSTAVYPFREKTYFSLNTAKENKWYALFMKAPYKIFTQNDGGIADVVNLRNDAEKVKEIVDGKKYFPAYHMNKKYWYSVLLDNRADLSEIEELLSESYHSIEK